MTHSKDHKVIILIGPPGSGKGTQAKLLAKKFNLEYLGSGDILRARQKVGDFTGKKLAEIMDKGELIPCFQLVDILGDTLENLEKRHKSNGIVLDGWTRKLFEAMLIEEALNWYNWDKNTKIIFIKISSKGSFNRLTKRRQCKKCGQIIPWIGEFKKLEKCNKCGGDFITRPDDNIAAIKKRLEEFKKETIKVVNYFRKKKRLIEINGEQSIENVFKDILRKIRW